MGERLVFVTIKDGPTLPSGRPLRRAVVPVDTTTTWKSFQSVVMKKLRVAQVGSFYSKQVREPKNMRKREREKRRERERREETRKRRNEEEVDQFSGCCASLAMNVLLVR